MAQDLDRMARFRQMKNSYVSLKCMRLCAGRATLKDRAGNAWCEQCKARHELIEWGYAHKYPLLCSHHYAIGEGYAMWMTCALIGSDAYVAEMLDVAHKSQPATR